MKTPCKAERRLSERTPCALKTSYRLPGRKMNVGETRNISDGGVLLMLSGKVKKNDLLDLEIPMGMGEEPLKARGRIIHIHSHGGSGNGGTLAGVAFLALNEQQQEVLGKKIWHQILKESTRFGRD